MNTDRGQMGADNHRIKAIFFDFGGVLLKTFDGVDHDAIEAEFGLEAKALRKAVYRDSRYMDFQVGACTFDEWADSIRQALAAIVADRADAVLATFQNAPRELNYDTIDLVARLRTAGYRTGIISNTTPGMLSRMQERDAAQPPERRLVPLFDPIIGSGDLRIAKPDVGIFLHATRLAGVAPEHSVFTDDRADFAEAARTVGMQGFHFTECERFVEDLRSVGVDAG